MLFQITRSDPHATQLAKQLAGLGVSSVHAQLMTIKARKLSGSDRAHLLNLDRFDTVIAVSANAAHALAELIDQYWPQLPVGLRWIAIGKGTADALASAIPELPRSIILCPEGTDSEALLKLPELKNPKGLKVLLAKGVGGRTLIQDALTNSGASVSEVELYQREPAFDQAASVINALEQAPSFIQIASGDAFFCLLALLKQQHQNKAMLQHLACQWLVPSDRVAAMLVEHGIGNAQIMVCEGASNQAITEKVRQHLNASNSR